MTTTAGRHGVFADAGAVAAGLRARSGGAAGALFAVVLGAGSVLGASAVTLATSYAVGDYFGLRHSLHRPWREARATSGTADRLTWTMPPIESLGPPPRSAWRTLGLVVLRCYLVLAVIVLAVRALQIALGTG
jgi:hypothetical protein